MSIPDWPFDIARDEQTLPDEVWVSLSGMSAPSPHERETAYLRRMLSVQRTAIAEGRADCVAADAAAQECRRRLNEEIAKRLRIEDAYYIMACKSYLD